MKKCPNQKTHSAECFGVSNMMFPGLACLPNTKSPPIPTKCSAKHEMPTKTHEMLGQTRKARQYLRNARPNTKCPPIPTKCSAKHEKPTNTYEKPRPNTKCPPKPTKSLGQTRKAHQYLRNASAKREMPHQTPTSPPAPLPWGEGSMLHKKQKALTQTHRMVPLPPRPKPHHLMKCERAARHCRVALSHFGGGGGTGPPTKKTKNMGDWSPHKKGDWSLIKKTKMYFPHRGLLDLTKRFRLFLGVMNFAWS